MLKYKLNLLLIFAISIICNNINVKSNLSNSGNFDFPNNIIQLNIDTLDENCKEESGYIALKNGLLISNTIKYDIDPKVMFEDINNQELTKDIVQGWESTVKNSRKKRKISNYIKSKILQDLQKFKKDGGFNNDKSTEYITEVLADVIKDIKRNYVKEEAIDLDSESVINLFVEHIIKKFPNNSKEDIIKILPKFQTLSFDISNVEDLTDLSSKDIYNIYKQEINNKNSSLIVNLEEKKENELICIEDPKDDVNSILKAFNHITNNSVTLLIIKVEDHWATCIANKIENQMLYFLADPFNDKLKEDEDFLSLIQFLSLACKNANLENNVKDINLENNISENKFPSFNPNNNQQNKEKPSYKSPYFDLELDQLPPLEKFFNNKVPNKIKNLIRNLSLSKKNNFITDSKKGLILYGPPGTGKSTIAEIIARQAGREVMFIDGGSFKTEFQGSGAKIVSELFETAKAKNKPVVIVIDEIDGATPKLRKNFGTNEDNQTIKKIISELNENLLSQNSSIYLICTTNYLENIESALLNRFTTMEVKAPDYNLRLDILKSYLKMNDIILEEDSKNFEVSNDFLDLLASATSNWTGRDLKEIINNAVNEYRNPDLSPEEDKSMWKFMLYNKYDFKNRKLNSMLNTSIMLLNPIRSYFKKYTKLERFIYSSYISELERMKKVKESDLDLYNESTSKMVKNALINNVSGFIITGTLGAISTYSVPLISKFIFSKLFNKNQNSNHTIKRSSSLPNL